MKNSIRFLLVIIGFAAASAVGIVWAGGAPAMSNADRRILSERNRDLNGCFKQALSRVDARRSTHPRADQPAHAPVKLTILVSLQTSGKVAGIKIPSNTLRDNELNRCVAEVIEGQLYEPAPSGHDVSLLLTFQRGKALKF